MNNTELEVLKKELSKEQGLLLSIEKIIEQIKIFENGIQPLKLARPCKIGDGIKLLSEVEENDLIDIFNSESKSGKVLKFVPASGAATRMFKKQLSVLTKFENINLFKLKNLAENGDEDCNAALEYFMNIDRFAFYEELKNVIDKNGLSLDKLIKNEEVNELIRFVTNDIGLNYANLPKGCIIFHSYPEEVRTAFEEHIVEAMHYTSLKNKTVEVHFTISPEHEREIKNLFKSILEKYTKNGWKFDISFSFQSPDTDTISVNMENKLLRDKNGKVVFRPGGHGALLKNLNELKADVISIKNIDNIVPDYLKIETYKYKKILIGYLFSIQKKVFSFLKKLETAKIDAELITEVSEFIRKEFDIDLSSQLKEKLLNENKNYLIIFLNRPIRICGMVKREDHPGGSPFWVKGKDGELTKQIVETAQVEMSDLQQNKIFNDGTHFNPVDLVCSIKDFKGNNFDLEKFSNPETGLISKKSKDGQEIKALELPGLWNGGMYYWLTVFVEIPKITFNPVKEVNDLLKPEHQKQ